MYMYMCISTVSFKIFMVCSSNLEYITACWQNIALNHKP